MITQLLMCAALLLGFAEEPKTGALFQTLPEDGVWAKYEVNLKINNQESRPIWHARSVGKAFHDGKECRFIELEQVGDGSSVPNLIWRFLIPESEFGNDKNPLSKAVKIWYKEGDDEPELVAILAEKNPLIASFFGGPEVDRKRESDKYKLTWQRGDLACEVISGRSDATLGTAKIAMHHRILREKSLPFGFAGALEELKIEGDNQRISAQFLLVDHGKDAMPKLPLLQP